MRSLLNCLFLSSVLMFAACGAGSSDTPTAEPAPKPPVAQVHTYAKTDGPIKNPMKGWNMGQWDNRAESTVAFTYIPWRDFEPNDEDFTSARIENMWALDWHLNRPGTHNRHLILRVFCQWDGAESDRNKLACPPWLMQRVNLLTGKNASGRMGGTVVDFNAPFFVEQAKEMIAALGARFDGDPRIYAIQLGIIGYWGQWHAFQFNPTSGGQGYSLAAETKSQILAAYKAAFPNKHLMGRYLSDSVLGSDNRIGYHNDYFWPKNSHNNHFEFSVGEKWRQGSISGETPPGSNGTEFYGAGAGLQSIERGRYSTMKPGAFYREPYSAGVHTEQHRVEREEYIKAQKLMGYNFQLEQASFPTSVLRGEARLPVVVEVSNIGLAPFYYDWDIELTVLDPATNRPLKSVKAAHRLTSFMPGARNTISVDIPLDLVPQGAHRVALRISQPGAAVVKSSAWKLDARNTYIEFANDMTMVPANWGSSHDLEGGWPILGDLSVR